MTNRVLEYEDLCKALNLKSDIALSVVTCDAQNGLIETLGNGIFTTGNIVLLGICLQGYASISLNGFVSTSKEGDFAVILPNSVLRFVETTPDYRARLLIGHISAQLEIANTLASFTDMIHNPIISLTIGERNTISRLFDYIAVATIDRSNIYRSNIVNKIYMLLCYEAGNIYRQRFSLNMKITRDEMIFHTFLDVLTRNYTKHRDVEFYATYMRLPLKTFGNKIKKATQKTPSQWIDEIVIDNAKTLLQTVDTPVSNVASRLGFANTSFFCQYFKRHTGKTPMEWRKKS